ncbi:MAG: hypothetical protein KGL39_56790, partial [Patescibacteria group bacterium]|nr:hypothetical protein [Patescibacteria group bacterium]
GSTFASRIDYRFAQASGDKVRIQEYSHPYPDVPTFKAVLASGRYICFGFPVYERLESPEVRATGILPVPERGERLLGGHEVCIVGYVIYEGELWFLVQNSWGTAFGLGGFLLMPPEYVLGYGSSDWRCIDQV